MKFQGYRILEKEGEYEGLQVFRAVVDGVDRHVQIRAFPTAIKRFPLILGQFRTTYRKLSQIQHKGILPIENVNTQAGQPYVVLPYVDAGSLGDRFRSGFYSALDVSQIVEEIAVSLDCAHQNSLIHGNLTPDSVLIDEEGRVHIVGFGEAAILGALPSSETQEMRRLTGFGPPEFVNVSKLSPATDQYSLALIALRLLTGLPEEEAVEALMSDIVKARRGYGREKRLSLDLSSQILEVLNRALAEKPSERFSSLAEFNHAFQVALGVVKQPRPATVRVVAPDIKGQEPKQKKRSMAIAPILTAVVVFGIAISVAVAQWTASSEPVDAIGTSVVETPIMIELPSDRLEDVGLSGNLDPSRNSPSLEPSQAAVPGGSDKSSPVPTAETSADQPQPTSISSRTDSPPLNPTSTNSPTSTETPTPDLTLTPMSTDTPGPSATPTPTNLEPTNTPQPTSTLTATPLPTNTATPTPRPTIKPRKCKSDPGHERYCTPTPSS